MSLYDKASLIMTPSGVKSAKIYSKKPFNANGDFTFDRSTTATRVNKDGLIETVANDIPRLNYPFVNGVVQDDPSLLLEPARTNLVTYSEDFSNVAWTKTGSSITSNSVISPDGTLNADKLTDVTGAGVHSISISPLFGVSDISFSIFVKYAGSEYIVIRSNSASGTYKNCTFNLLTGVNTFNGFSGSFKITSMPNGWFRISGVNTSSASAFRINSFILSPTDVTNNNNPSYTADGTGGVYIYGAQIEAGSYPTSYIPNLATGSTTRAAETANGAGTSADFNDLEGVLYFDGSVSTTNETVCISINDGSLVNRVEFLWFSDGKLYTQVGNSGQTAIDSNTLNNKISINWNNGTYSLSVNGFRLITDTYTSLSGLDSLDFKRQGSFAFYGNTKEIAVFKTALTDTELESLTSWDSFNDMATGQLYSIK